MAAWPSPLARRRIQSIMVCHDAIDWSQRSAQPSVPVESTASGCIGPQSIRKSTDQWPSRIETSAVQRSCQARTSRRKDVGSSVPASSATRSRNDVPCSHNWSYVGDAGNSDEYARRSQVVAFWQRRGANGGSVARRDAPGASRLNGRRQARTRAEALLDAQGSDRGPRRVRRSRIWRAWPGGSTSGTRSESSGSGGSSCHSSLRVLIGTGIIPNDVSVRKAPAFRIGRFSGGLPMIVAPWLPVSWRSFDRTLHPSEVGVKTGGSQRAVESVVCGIPTRRRGGPP